RAGALDLHPLLDDEGRGVEVADDVGGDVQLDRVPSSDVPPHRAAFDDDRRDVDVGFDLGAFADDQNVVAVDLAAQLAIDAHAALEKELSLETRAASEQGGEFDGGAGFH